MPLNLPNWMQAPMQKDAYKGIGDFAQNAIGAYQGVQNHQKEQEKAAQEMMLGKQKLDAGEITNKYLEQMQKAKIAYLEKAGSKSAGSGGIWRNLPIDTRSDILAQVNGFGGDPAEAAAFINNNGTFEQYKDMKRKEGYDVDTAEKLYPATGRNRSDINSTKGYVAELDVLENLMEEGLEDYNDYFLGYSPSQVADQIKGLNPDKQARFLARRAMQSEIAGTRTRILGGSNAQEALKDMQEKSLGNVNVFRTAVNKDVYAKTQKYLNEWIKEGAKARTDVMSGKGYKVKKKDADAEMKANAIRYEQEKRRNEETAGINDLSPDELDRLIEEAG